MTEFENKSENEGLNLSGMIRKILIGIIILILLFVLIATGQIIFLVQVFSWIENKVRSLTGLDVLLAKALAALIMGGLLVLPMWKLLVSFLPLPQKNKKLNRFIFLGMLALMFAASFVASKRVFFDPDSGKPLKYYSISSDGAYKFYSSDGYDPVTGDKLLPINKDVVSKHLNSGKNKEKKKTAEQIEEEKNLAKEKQAIEAERARLEQEKLRIEKEKALLRNKPSGNSSQYEVESKKSGGIIIPELVTLSIKDPVGIEKSVDFYPVVVSNSLDKKVFFFISAKIRSESEINVFPLSAKSSLSISVCEGHHYFGFIDVNGNNVDRNSLDQFYDYNDDLYFDINEKRYRSDYNHIISVPEKKEIILSDK